ncbi:GerMN domain-containing protein [Arcanobacterium haemolyticum]|nr:GerMN domain-containing protein [Arcanobacterium haemolyticum]
MTRLRALAGFLVLALALTGCASLPRSGDVHAVQPSPMEEGEVGLVARPPSKGATPKQIVAGFLDATAAGFDDDFAVARQYLLGSASTTWNPLASVRVYLDTQNIQATATETGAIRVSVGSLGTVSDKGVYSESSNDATTTTDFSLAKNADGEWRIVSLDDGIFLSEHLFAQLYVKSPLYFLSTDQNALVADLHWYPRKTFATQAVRALLQGPASWLSSGTTSAFPSNTALVGSVSVANGVASVSLSSEVLAATQDQRSKLTAQLHKTLTSLSTIQEVQVSVQGVPLETTEAADLPTYPYSSYPLSIIADGVPSLVSASDGTTPISSDPTVASLGLTRLASSYADINADYAALNSDGTKLYRITSSGATELMTGTNLIGPSFDSYGWIWTGETQAQGELSVVGARGERNITVAASWLSGVTIRDIAVSREGNRVAIVGVTSGSTAVYLSSINRDSQGQPISISDPVQIAQRLTDVTDVSWLSPTDLVAAGTTAAGAENGLYQIQAGGPMTRLTAPGAGVAAITSGRDEESIAALTTNNTVLGRSGGAWRSVATNATSLAYPG